MREVVIHISECASCGKDWPECTCGLTANQRESVFAKKDEEVLDTVMCGKSVRREPHGAHNFKVSDDFSPYPTPVHCAGYPHHL